LTGVVAAVEAVREFRKATARIPEQYRHVTYFSQNDIWIFDSLVDGKRCPICEELEYGFGENASQPATGLHLRAWFAGIPYAGMVILDQNTIGGPAANGDGLMHPNCRCRLRRKIVEG
jgi:hypothetical protein